MTGLIREHLFSDPGPSCIGFNKKEGGISPKFEDEEKDFQDLFIVDLIQRGALDFTRDYITAFREYIKYIPFKSQEVSLVFEGMLINAKDFDRRIFKASYFEDLVYGARDRINIYDFIKNEIEILKSENSILSLDSGMDYSSMIEKILWGRNRIIKCIIYAMFDRKILKEKVKTKLKDKPIIFKACKKGYKILKKIFR